LDDANLHHQRFKEHGYTVSGMIWHRFTTGRGRKSKPYNQI